MGGKGKRAATWPHIERVLSTCTGLTIGTLTVLTSAKRRDAYLVAATLFTVVTIIAVTLAAPVALRVGLGSACLAAVGASLAAYMLIPERSVARTAGIVRAGKGRYRRMKREGGPSGPPSFLPRKARGG